MTRLRNVNEKKAKFKRYNIKVKYKKYVLTRTYRTIL